MVATCKMTAEFNQLFTFIQDIKSDLQSKATNVKVDELLAAITKKVGRILLLEESVQSLTKYVDLLTRKNDNIKLGSRRNNLRI